MQAVTRMVKQLLYTPRQGCAEASHVVVRVDVCLAFQHALLEALPILLQVRPLEERVGNEILAHPRGNGLVHEEIREVRRLPRRARTRKRLELGGLQSSAVRLDNGAMGRLVEARPTVREDEAGEWRTGTAHLPQDSWQPVDECGHPVAGLLPLPTHRHEPHRPSREDNEPPRLAIPPLLLLLGIGAPGRFLEYCFEALETQRLPLPFLLFRWWKAVRRLPGMMVLQGSIQIQCRAYQAGECDNSWICSAHATRCCMSSSGSAVFWYGSWWSHGSAGSSS